MEGSGSCVLLQKSVLLLQVVLSELLSAKSVKAAFDFELVL